MKFWEALSLLAAIMMTINLVLFISGLLCPSKTTIVLLYLVAILTFARAYSGCREKRTSTK